MAKWINELKDWMFWLSFTDYAEELRFYLIHMTEVRDLYECMCVCVRWAHVGREVKEAETEGKTESNVNSLFGLWARGATDSGGNHITGKKQGLAESSTQTVFSPSEPSRLTVSATHRTHLCIYIHKYQNVRSRVSHLQPFFLHQNLNINNLWWLKCFLLLL